VDDFKERIDSGKNAIMGAVVGSICGALPDFLTHTNSLPQWEFNTDAMAIQGALFGVVYRYCVREDSNPQLKQGCVGAFVLIRALPQVQVSSVCKAFPLNCGPPFFYLDWGMLTQITCFTAESLCVFGGVSFAFEYLSNRDIIGRFPSTQNK